VGSDLPEGKASIVSALLAVGGFTSLGIRLAIYMLASLLIGMIAREYAVAWMATRLGDATPRLWGRLTFNPKAWFEPFGSGLVPGLIAVLWSVGVLMIPAAYAKPAPIDTSRLRGGTRGIVFVSIAGPLATLAVGILSGLIVRVGSALPLEVRSFTLVLSYTSMSLVVFHLLPIPGLDGARLVALLLPPPAREVYRNADKYLPLFVLVVLFVFSTLLLGLLTSIAGALCDAATGGTCGGFLSG
jgi:Zn-dependent protease